MILLNNNQQKYFNTANGSESAIDLTLSSTSIAEYLEMAVADELHDSDHYPIIINLVTPNQNDNLNYNVPEIRNYRKANWTLHQEEIIKRIPTLEIPTTNNKSNINCLVENFNSIISKAADIAVPLVKIKEKAIQVPWWDELCEKASNEAKHSFNRYKKQNILTNKIEHNKRRLSSKEFLRKQKKYSG